MTIHDLHKVQWNLETKYLILKMESDNADSRSRDFKDRVLSPAEQNSATTEKDLDVLYNIYDEYLDKEREINCRLEIAEEALNSLKKTIEMLEIVCCENILTENFESKGFLPL